MLRVDLREMEQALGEGADELLRDVAIELGNQLQIEAPVGATGDLQKSFAILGEQDGVVYVGSRLPYADDVQYGTAPHIVEDFEALKVWARRKLGDEAAAGPVFRKIAEEGTNANPYVDRAIENTVARFRS